MTIHVERLRADTPGTLDHAHLNNAGAALMPTPVLQRVLDHLNLEARVGGYEAQALASQELERGYASMARLLHAHPQEIALVENATRAWQMAFHAFRFQPGDVILTSSGEYSSNHISMLHLARHTGAVVEFMPFNAQGEVDLEKVRSVLETRRVKMVALTHLASSGGALQPAQAVGALCRSAGIPFVLDACQSAGQVPLDVEELQCDVLSGTSRKFLRGPRGVGFLYVRQSFLDRLEPPLLDNHSASLVDSGHYTMANTARRFETWESNVAARLGFGAAVEYALETGVGHIRTRVDGLASELREMLAALPGVRVHDTGTVLSGIVTFSHKDHAATALKTLLAGKGVAVSVLTRAMAQLDMEARGLPEMVRASVHAYNTREELERLCKALPR